LASEAKKRAEGFTLIEVVVGLLLLAIGLIATVPMFAYAARENAVGGDLGSVGARAVQRMEILRGTSWLNLAGGGALDSDVSGYFDGSDPDVVVRWTVADNVSPDPTKTIVVRAIAQRQVVGLPKQATLVVVRGP
jgi:prepilin-type N-terminal cleavage/methylation domain-containing protein